MKPILITEEINETDIENIAPELMLSLRETLKRKNEQLKKVIELENKRLAIQAIKVQREAFWEKMTQLAYIMMMLGIFVVLIAFTYKIFTAA